MQAAGHRLEVSLPADPVWLEGDPVRLAQIVANLLDNAAKYTEDGGWISVRAHREGARASLSVRDNGIGIPPESVSHMFEMFSRGNPANGRGQGGLGIGLALARRLAEMHGGTLGAVSEGPGRGSEFTLQLPLAADQVSAPNGATEAAAAAVPQQRILVVDDNRDAADSLSMVLKFLGADVRVARDGRQALEEFDAYDPAVVLLDIGMPGMDGYEAAGLLRESLGPDAVIVALTGYAEDADETRAKSARIDRHVLKPLDPRNIGKILRLAKPRPRE
jgi:CheY-like chemotaxis protein